MQLERSAERRSVATFAGKSAVESQEILSNVSGMLIRWMP
jgi:hypothetical protein